MAVKTSATQQVLEAIHDEKGFWLGASDREDEGNFQWINSTGGPEEPVRFSKWSARQPDNSKGKEHCVTGT